MLDVNVSDDDAEDEAEAAAWRSVRGTVNREVFATFPFLKATTLKVFFARRGGIWSCPGGQKKLRPDGDEQPGLYFIFSFGTTLHACMRSLLGVYLSESGVNTRAGEIYGFWLRYFVYFLRVFEKRFRVFRQGTVCSSLINTSGAARMY